MQTIVTDRMFLLQQALEKILTDGKLVIHYSIVPDEESSHRIFFSGPYADAVQLPQPMNAREITEMIRLFFAGSEARYPESKPKGTVKGFEARFDVAPPALFALRAVWVNFR